MLLMLYLGLIARRQRWGLTLWGWITLGLGGCVLGVLCVHTIHGFLAPSQPIECDLLVVEGWLNDYALEEAIQTFEDHSCRLLVTTGTPILQGSSLLSYRNYAKLAASILERKGFATNRLRAVPSPLVKRDRTYASALALKQWLPQAGIDVRAVNLFSLGPHARRSWWLYRKALGDEIAVGVIAAQTVRYDPKAWWKSSNGVRLVLDEMIAYVYARFLFTPNG